MRRLISFCVRSPWMVMLFAAVLGATGWALLQTTPVDAFPDVSENQVIVFTDWMGRSPQDVEDQVTYPLSTALAGLPGVRDVRSMSAFGFSQIYVVFYDHIDVYWARTRVLERLSTAAAEMPEGARPQLGPDASALGQVFWYALESADHDLAELRSLQDFHLRYELQSVEGVAEVAGVGGFVRQYQVDVDPNALKAYDISIRQVIDTVRRGNIDVGARTFEQSGMEFVIRGLGFVRAVSDLEDLVVRSVDGTPVFLRQVATVHIGSQFRRGALADEHGERVGGVVTMRLGANPGEVIDRVKERIATLEASLPPGVRIVSFYDRTELIDETLATLRTALTHELLITLIVVLLFLLHVRTSLIVATTLPLAVLTAFVGMRVIGVGADIMSLSGIAIAIGTVVDMGIIMGEAIFARLLERGRRDGEEREGTREREVAAAAHEMAPAILTAVATTVISFLPVFFLTGESGKLFTPLAWTKTFAMVASVILAVTLVPAMCRVFLRDSSSGEPRDGAERDGSWGRALAIVVMAGVGAAAGSGLARADVLAGSHPWVGGFLGALALGALAVIATYERMRPIEANPVSRGILRVYQPSLVWILGHKGLFLMVPVVVLLLGAMIFVGLPRLLLPARALGAWAGVDIDDIRPVAAAQRVFPGIGSEFMPPLDEGSYLTMPSLMPQASLNETMRVMLKMNEAIASVPEVSQVMGKLGRADSPLDPAPIGMIETIVNLVPRSEWREGVTQQDILEELRRRTHVIGATPSWLQPIETRIVMLQSGIRAQMAIRLMGAPRDESGVPHAGLEAYRVIEETAQLIEEVIRDVPGLADATVMRQGGKPYFEFDLDRRAIGRYGLTVREVQDVIEAAVGGVDISWTVEGRERYPIRVAYKRELRDRPEALEELLVPVEGGVHVPMSALASIRHVIGPASIRTENGQLTGYVMFNAHERDQASVVDGAMARIAAWRAEQQREHGRDPVPAGLVLSPTGRYKSKLEADQRLMLILPLVLLINFFLIYLRFRDVLLTATVFLAIPVSFAGGFILLWLYPYLLDLLHMGGLRSRAADGPIYLTTAVWVGFIALFGIAVDDGIVIGTYLRQEFKKKATTTVEEVRRHILEAGSRRIRPMLMTTVTTILALMPILWSTGRGADLMQPMALPIVGGMLFAFVTAFVVPTIFAWVMETRLKMGLLTEEQRDPHGPC